MCYRVLFVFYKCCISVLLCVISVLEVCYEFF